MLPDALVVAVGCLFILFVFAAVESFLAEQCLSLAQKSPNSIHHRRAHLGGAEGDTASAREQREQRPGTVTRGGYKEAARGARYPRVSM